MKELQKNLNYLITLHENNILDDSQLIRSIYKLKSEIPIDEPKKELSKTIRAKRKRVIDYIIRNILESNPQLKLDKIKYNNVTFDHNGKKIHTKISVSGSMKTFHYAVYPTSWNKISIEKGETLEEYFNQYDFFIYVLSTEKKDKILLFSSEEMKQLAIQKNEKLNKHIPQISYYFTFEPNNNAYEIRGKRIDVSHAYIENRPNGWKL